jgi:hypothetical protein
MVFHRCHAAQFNLVPTSIVVSDVFFNRCDQTGFIFYNAVISKEKLDKFFYTKNGFKKFAKDEYIELGKKAGFQRIRIKALGDNYGLLIIYRK